LNEPAALEAAKHAAEVAGVQLEVAGEIGGSRAGSVGDLIEHARFGERK
jgi:hypothetical protein